jgi:hypothetical protein
LKLNAKLLAWTKKRFGSIAMRISRAAKEAEMLGLSVFGGSGCGSLRAAGQVIVADLDGSYDGGDGGAQVGEDGLFRGEIV